MGLRLIPVIQQLCIHPHTITSSHHHILTPSHRLRDLKKELEALEARLAAAERNAASYDAQRKAIQGEKSKFQKRVSTTIHL